VIGRRIGAIGNQGLNVWKLHGDRQLVTEALRRSGQVLAADGEVGDKAVLAVGALFSGVADIEHGGGDGLALAGLLEDDVGVAAHQAVDRGEIPDFIGAGGCLGG
jgi:hypothetical protein